jgi:hypothetical protein
VRGIIVTSLTEKDIAMRQLFTTAFFLVFTTLLIGQKVTIQDPDDNVMIEVNDEGTTGSISLPPSTAPTFQKDKLYNISHDLYWDGTRLGTLYEAGGWRVSGVNLHTYDSDYEVGIGTTSPLWKFEVHWNTGTSNVLNPIALFRTVGTGNSVGALRVQNSYDNYFNFGITTDPTNAFAINYGSNIGLSSDLLRLTPDGYLGVGIISPEQRLHIDGKFKLGDDSLDPTAGVIRYNSSSQEFEGYDGSSWNSFVGGGKWLENGSNIYYNSGNVGTGTSSPTAKQHITQGTSADAFRVDDAIFDTSPFIIKEGGNVGIGLTTPLNKLHIEGNSTTNITAHIHNLDDSGSESLYFGTDGASDAGIESFGNAASGSYAGKFRFFNNKTSAHYEWLLNTQRKMTLDNSGQLGIGIASPTEKLHVAGDMALGDSDNSSILKFYHDGTYVGYVGEIDSILYLNQLLNKKLFLQTNATTRLAIDGYGNTGIGTVTPSQKLHVKGKIKIGTDSTTPSAGVIRYNGTNSKFEGYNGSAWNEFTGAFSLPRDDTAATPNIAFKITNTDPGGALTAAIQGKFEDNGNYGELGNKNYAVYGILPGRWRRMAWQHGLWRIRQTFG